MATHSQQLLIPTIQKHTEARWASFHSATPLSSQVTALRLQQTQQYFSCFHTALPCSSHNGSMHVQCGLPGSIHAQCNRAPPSHRTPTPPSDAPVQFHMFLHAAANAHTKLTQNTLCSRSFSNRQLHTNSSTDKC